MPELRNLSNLIDAQLQDTLISLLVVMILLEGFSRMIFHKPIIEPLLRGAIDGLSAAITGTITALFRAIRAIIGAILGGFWTELVVPLGRWFHRRNGWFKLVVFIIIGAISAYAYTHYYRR